MKTGLGSFAGFTLVEMVVVILVAGILAIWAAPRFFASGVFEEPFFVRETLSAAMYARRLAMVSGCEIRFRTASSGYVLERYTTPDCRFAPGAGTAPVVRPGGSDPFSGAPPAGVVIGSSDICFDPLGRPRNGATGSLIASPLVIGIGGESLTIEPETGYAHL